MKVKYLILGAGPSGLSLAVRLKQLGENSFLVLEKESEVGGLCRSIDVDGSPLDIGGGHFLDIKKREVLDFIFSFLPKSEWNLFNRISRIQTDSNEIDYPYEANIWQLPIDDQIEHLKSIFEAGENNGKPKPEKFSDWIIWKFGYSIANNYLLPYNRKIFANINLDELGTYWLEKLPDVSFEDTLRSCLLKKPFGNLPAHTQFYYPKHFGYGEVFSRMGNYLGDKLLTSYSITTVNFDDLKVNNEIVANRIINTIPWPVYLDLGNLPQEIKKSILQLKYSSIDVRYQSDESDSISHWTYFPNSDLSFHRILYRKNFIDKAKGYWQELNSIRTHETSNYTIFHNKYSYPLNTQNKRMLMNNIKQWAESRTVTCLGRWGEWEHMNSDVAIEKSILLSKELLEK